MTAHHYERVEGVVYCLVHGSIHRDDGDPYEVGENECRRGEHRTVYFRRREGDA